ncbi:MAG: glycine zipper 2TM domain-containing protein, partial [Xanthomonadaceae bacterium]|nr:glycine zipper 2TM domain-containing protein [Xanthomonadaceae bacterium]
MKHQTLAVAIASLLVGGVATAAYLNNRAPRTMEATTEAATAAADATMPIAAPTPSSDGSDLPPDNRISIPSAGRLDYAEVVAVKPISERRTLYGTVIGTEPVRETTVATVPREICEDVVVQERLPERDGNVGGAVAGAVIGGLVGNQVGDGNGRKLATVAGAVGGGFAGREIDKRHVGGKVVNRTERQCRTESSTTTSSKTVAWNVTYREPNGRTGMLRSDQKPGKRITLGTESE